MVGWWAPCSNHQDSRAHALTGYGCTRSKYMHHQGMGDLATGAYFVHSGSMNYHDDEEAALALRMKYSRLQVLSTCWDLGANMCSIGDWQTSGLDGGLFCFCSRMFLREVVRRAPISQRHRR